MKKEQNENECVLVVYLFSGFVTSFCLPQSQATRELINLIRVKLFHASPKPVCGV